MIKINKNHLHLFKKFGRSYNYYVSQGVWLSFDIKDLSYTGIELFYLTRNIKEIEHNCNNLIKTLIARDILYVSRTYKDRRKDYSRIPKSKLYKSILHIYGEDMKHKRKDRTLNRLLRKRLKDIEESR